MPLKVTELFGFSPESPEIGAAVRSLRCPFIGETCRKKFGAGMPSGLCTASQSENPEPIICCPQRLYANDHQVLRQVSAQAFGSDVPLQTGAVKLSSDGDVVIPFGQRMGRELRVGVHKSSYSFDWILALVDRAGELKEFVAVEVQTIDTTGNYQRQSWDIQSAHQSPHIERYAEPPAGKASNFNFENVNKRILPQLITKGHVLRLETLCKKGLFFVCPTPVLHRIMQRVGGNLRAYSPQPGSITFHDYTIDVSSEKQPYPLVFGEARTTTLDQLYLAFASPQNLPPQDAYTQVVRDAVRQRISAR